MNDALFNGLGLLAQNFYKILEIDLSTDLYQEIIIDKNEKSDKRHVREWVKDFAETGIHPDDKERFLKFFNPDEVKMYMRHNWMKRLFYRRKVGNRWRYVCMEVIPLSNYSENDPIVLLVVRDVDDYIKDYHEQIGWGV